MNEWNGWKFNNGKWRSSHAKWKKQCVYVDRTFIIRIPILLSKLYYYQHVIHTGLREKKKHPSQQPYEAALLSTERRCFKLTNFVNAVLFKALLCRHAGGKKAKKKKKMSFNSTLFILIYSAVHRIHLSCTTLQSLPCMLLVTACSNRNPSRKKLKRGTNEHLDPN